MGIPVRVLMIEDDENDAFFTLRALTRGDIEIAHCTRVETETDLQKQLQENVWDLVISDYRLPRFSAPEALTLLQRHMEETGQDIPFVVISGTIGEETAVALMKAGAADYLIKGNLNRLVPAVTRELREAESRRQRRHAEEALREGEARQRTFIRDVLYGVTEGRLHLCDTEGELPPPLPPTSEPIKLTPESLSLLRRNIRQAVAAQGLSSERGYDLLTASGEVAMNAVVHGGGGQAWVTGGDGAVQVWVQDRGMGIDMQQLPRATLERGYSSAGTMGHGFYLVLSTVDRTWLLTGKTGTTVVVEQNQNPPEAPWIKGLFSA